MKPQTFQISEYSVLWLWGVKVDNMILSVLWSVLTFAIRNGWLVFVILIWVIEWCLLFLIKCSNILIGTLTHTELCIMGLWGERLSTSDRRTKCVEEAGNQTQYFPWDCLSHISYTGKSLSSGCLLKCISWVLIILVASRPETN